MRKRRVRRRRPVEQLAAGIGAYLDAALESDVARVTLVDAPGVLGLDVPDSEPGPGHLAMRAYIAASMNAGAIASVDPDMLTICCAVPRSMPPPLVARSVDLDATKARAAPVLHRLIAGLRPS